MKIIAGADFHGFKPALEQFAEEAKAQEADVIVLCGDITNFGTVRQAKDLLSILAGKGILVLFVPGNCDPPLLTDLNLKGVKCIHGAGIVYGDLLFVGIGGSPITPFNTFFEMDEKEIAETLERCLSNLSDEISQYRMILVSHSPPKNTGLDRTFFGIHAGSTSVRKFIREHKPLLAICGHIHEARGEERLNGTLIVNPGPAKQGNYAIIRVDGEIVEIKLQTLKMY